jgi:predicted transglutaminase-like cysteine proteinase
LWERRFDWSKLPKEKVDHVVCSDLHPDCLDFVVQKVDVGSRSHTFVSTGRTLSFDDLVSGIMDTYETKVARDLINKASYKKTAQRYEKFYDCAKPEMNENDSGIGTSADGPTMLSFDNVHEAGDAYDTWVHDALEARENQWEFQFLENESEMLRAKCRRTKGTFFWLAQENLFFEALAVCRKHAFKFYGPFFDDVYKICFDVMCEQVEQDPYNVVYSPDLLIDVESRFIEKLNERTFEFKVFTDDMYESAMYESDQEVKKYPVWLQCYYYICRFFEKWMVRPVLWFIFRAGGNPKDSWKIFLAKTGLRIAGAIGAYNLVMKAAKKALELIFVATGVIKDEGGMGYDSSVKAAKVRRRVTKGKHVREFVVPQALSANQAFIDTSKKVVNGNLFQFLIPFNEFAEIDNKYYNSGFMLGLRNRYLLAPYHFASYLQSWQEQGHGEATCYVTRCVEKRRDCPITVNELLACFISSEELMGQDLCIFNMPRKFQPVADITHFFATEKEIVKLNKVNAALIIFDDEKANIHHMIAENKTDGLRITPRSDMEGYQIHHVWQYRVNTTKGDCGSPLFADLKGRHRSLIGIHVAGTNVDTKTLGGIGFSSVVSYELISRYVNDKEVLFPDEAITNVVEQGNLVSLGRVKQAPRANYNTSLRRSPLYNKVYKSKVGPAVLRPVLRMVGEEEKLLDPRALALEKYCVADAGYDIKTLNEAVHDMFDFLKRESKIQVCMRILTYEEAILGIEDEPDFKSLPRGTSAGYPYNTMPGKSDKSRFFGDGDTYDLGTPAALELKEKVLRIEEDARKGIRNLHVFTDSLKDEKRPLEKIEAVKTRLFSGGPIEYLILVRRYFGSFFLFCVKNRIANNMALGINPYSGDWHIMAKMLLHGGTKDDNVIGAGDYSAFDSRHLASIQTHLLDLIQKFYRDGPENYRIRKILFLEITNSIHVSNGELYAWRGAMASGNPLTSLLNCMYNMVCFRYCWIRLMESEGYYAHEFDKYVKLFVLGDDNVFGVHKDVANTFNEYNLQLPMAELGMIYTPEDKTLKEFSTSLRKISEVSFLKRGFRIHELNGQWVGPLDLDTIMETINWCHKGHGTPGEIEDIISGVVAELSLHPRAVFDHFVQEIRDCLEDLGDLHFPGSSRYETVFAITSDRG